jgi:hypothetical protein
MIIRTENEIKNAVVEHLRDLIDSIEHDETGKNYSFEKELIRWKSDNEIEEMDFRYSVYRTEMHKM